MLELVVAERPELYPSVDRAFAKIALWTAFPVAVVSPTGRIRAANHLASWIAGKNPARDLLGANIIDLTLELVGEQRIPPACNVELVRKKWETLEHLESRGQSLVQAIFRKLWGETMQAAATVPVVEASCPVVHSMHEVDKRRPWQYPVRMYPPDGVATKTLLAFTAIEARLGRGAFLIILEPDDVATKTMLAEVYASYDSTVRRAAYVFAQAGVDIDPPQGYNQEKYYHPEVKIIPINDKVKAEIESRHQVSDADNFLGRSDESQALPVPAPGGRTTMVFRAQQPLRDRDCRRICRALDAEHVLLPEHPELGAGDGFRLEQSAAPGRVTQVDLYLHRSPSARPAVRVHRLDDFGEPHAPRYGFDLGYLQEGEHPALIFWAGDGERQRVVAVGKDGEAEERYRTTAAMSEPPLPEEATAVAVAAATEEVSRGWLTMREALAEMGISWSYAKKLIASGDLQARQRGKLWFVDPASARTFQRKRLRPSG